ncbi:MAG: hypothetical protein HC916_09335 [Coleofasciculaceae cyanobacterium SM2_1_6]|nr:hypothetical protein [Coleofasciculaceae cyanobacterium SM2_1_6]
MQLGAIVSHIFIDPSKLIKYSLNKNHKDGGNKAIMFEQYLGFTPENYQLLLEQIQSKVMDAEAVIGYYDEYGQRYRVDILIVGVELGQQEIVRTGWLVDPDNNIAKLTTVFIRSRK